MIIIRETLKLRSVPYITLRTFDAGTELREGLSEWFLFYNRDRFHQSLDNQTPDEVYYALPHPFAEAA